MLSVSTLSHQQHHFLAIAHVETFFRDNPSKNSLIRTIGTVFENSLLACKGCGIDKVSNRYLIGPSVYPVVEDVVEVSSALQEIAHHLFSSFDTQIRSNHIQQMRVQSHLEFSLGQLTFCGALGL